MKVSIEWLSDYVDIPGDTRDISNKLLCGGLEVDTVHSTGIGKENTCVCQIDSIEKHPEADRLFVTRVDVGSQGKKQVITNLKGLRAGDKLLVHLEGVNLSNGMKIKDTKLKGVLSQGMFAGWEDFGFTHKPEEAVMLDPSFENGKKYYDIAPIIDDIIDIELTANRGDCLGMIGVAREIKALYNIPGKELDYSYKTNGTDVNDLFKVRIDSPNCKRYCGAVIQNVKTEPAPLWMQLRLLKAGVRPINNIVDITNYVLLEMNQPLHAFDMDKINNKTLIVRNASKGEKMVTLDDIERSLLENDIVIADDQQGHCLGGVMGGQISEVSENTKNIFLEAAFFEPKNIRRASRRLGLRSESSYRFERTIDRDNVAAALKRALYWFDRLGVGEICSGLIDEYPEKLEHAKVDVTPEWINNKLGSSIEPGQMKDILTNLGFEVVLGDTINNTMQITVPAWRSDVTIKEDIAEEIGRIYSYNNIPETNFPSIQAASLTPFQQKERRLLNLLISLGLDELWNYSFVGKSLFDKMKLADDHFYRNIVNLGIPLTDDWAGMRNALIPGMVRALSYNVTRNNRDLAVFEYGNVSLVTGEKLPLEEKRVSLALTGKGYEKDHTAADREYDFFDIKGMVDALCENFRVKVSYKESNETIFQPGQQAHVFINGKEAGIVGKVHPALCDVFDIDVNAFCAELNVTMLFEEADLLITSSEVPRFPSSERDLAVIVDNSVTAASILDLIKGLEIAILHEVSIFDIYKDEHIGNEKYSIAVKLVFSHMTSTLTDEEINPEFEKILKKLTSELGAQLR